MALQEDDRGAAGSLESVLAEIRRGKAAVCYLLYGDEEFRLRDGVEKIVAALIPAPEDRDLNLFLVDGEHEEVDGLCESLSTPPLLPGRKIVVVRNTRLFQSKSVLAPLIARIRERLERDPARAAADFLQFLTLTGLALDDLRDNGWRKLDDETWRRIVPDDGGEGRETWLPKAVELCVSRGAVPARETPAETDRLERTLTGGMPAGNHLILTAETVDRRKRLFKTVAATGRVLAFTKLKGESRQQQALQEMAGEVLARAGKRLSAAAWAALGRKTGFELRESLGAIERLITYAGERAQIEAADVEALIGRTREETIFELTGSLGERRLLPALRSLKALLDQGNAPLMVLAMIVREVRFLFQAKLLLASGRLGGFAPAMDYGRFQKSVHPLLKELAADGGEGIPLAGQHPFVAYQALKNAGRFTQPELVAGLSLLVATDLALKTTGQDPRLLLERLLIRLCEKTS